MARDKVKELRRRVYLILEQGSVGDGMSVLVDRALVALILINLVAVALESVPSLRDGVPAAVRGHRILLARRLHGSNISCASGARSSTGRTGICRRCGRG